MTLAGGRACRG